jgi:5'-3' exonuclease
MCGEKGDNIPGVPGIGPVRASGLLRAHENLEEIISWGEGKTACKYSRQVYECRDIALTAQRLVTLRKDAPIVPIKPTDCLLK